MAIEIEEITAAFKESPSREITAIPRRGVHVTIDRPEGFWRFSADLASRLEDGTLKLTSVFGIGPKGECMPIGDLEVEP